MMTHTIRLRGHWESTAGDGLTRWSRRFGRPTGGGSITLRVVTATFPCRVRVNDGVLHDIVNSSVSIRLDSLKPRNVLTVDSATEPEAVLEIDDSR